MAQQIPLIKTRITNLKPVGTTGITKKMDIEQFSITSFDGQDTILFPEGKSYVPSSNTIFIFIDGKFLSPDNYVETSSTSVTLNSRIVGTGIPIVVRWFNRTTSAGGGGSVIVSYEEPKDKYDGLMWFNPDWGGAFYVWNSLEGQFQEFAMKRDIKAAGVENVVDGGTF